MSENTNVSVVITADDHASPVIRRLKAEIDGLRRSLDKSFKQSPATSAFLKSFKDLEQVARQQNQAAAAMQRQVNAVRNLAGANRQAAASYRIVESAGVQAFRRQMALASRMSRQRAAEEQAEARAHRSRIGRLEREHRISLRNASTYGRRSYQGLRGMDVRTPAMMTAAGTGAAALAARRILISEADTDAAEKNTIAYGGLSRDAARALREQWSGPLSVQLGATTAQMLSGYTEALKVGIPSEGAKAFSELAIKTSEAWSLPVNAVTDTLGIINQTLTAAGQAFDYKKLHGVANGIQHLAAKMATTPEKMISFLQRGAGAAALLGMSQEAGLAFGAASTSLGNQASESGRMFDFVAGRLIKLPQLTRQNGEEGNQARAMVRALGYGSAEQINRKRRASPDDFLFDFIERFQRIKDPRKREEAIRFFAGQEWLGEFGRMVTGSATLREAQKLAKESKGLDAIGQVWSVHQTKLLFVVKQIKAGFLNVLGEFGMVLSPIARQVGDFFLKWSAGLKSGDLRQKFEAALNGFIQGLGFKDITGLLEGIFGTSGEGLNSVERWRNIARAFGEGIRSAADQILAVIRSLSSVTGSGENLVQWGAYLGNWATAINLASPAFSILGTLAAPFLAFGNAVAAFLNLITAARLSAAVAAMGGAGASTGLLAGLAANPVWAAVGSAIAMGALASFANAKGILAPPEHGFSWRGFWEFLDPGLARRMFGDGKPKGESLNGGSGSDSLKGGSGKDLLYSVEKLNHSFKDVGSRLQLTALTGPGMFSGIGSSYSGGGGGSYSAAAVSPDVQSMFTPPAVPDHYLGGKGIISGAQAPRGLLDLIRKGETGTLGPQSWDTITGQWKGAKPSKAISQMTIAEVKAFQKLMLRNGVADSAVGGFQINNVTLEDFQKRLGLSDGAIFDQATQTQLADAIAKSTGGNISRLRGRWTALRKVPDSVIQGALSGGVSGSGAIGLDGVPVKGAQATAGGSHALGLTALAQELSSGGVAGGLNRFTAFRDRFHIGRRSKHNDGLATDFTIKDSRFSSQAAEQIRQKFRAAGLTDDMFKVIDEYKNPSSGATGGHIHAQFASQAAAALYQKYVEQQRALAAKSAAPAITSGVPTPQGIIQGVPLRGPSNNAPGQGSGTPTVQNFHINGTNLTAQEIAAAVNREITTSMNYRTHDVESELT